MLGSRRQSTILMNSKVPPQKTQRMPPMTKVSHQPFDGLGMRLSKSLRFYTESVRRHLVLANAVRRARKSPLDPFKLTWILTEECSLRCRTCHLWATQPHSGPDLTTIRKVLKANQHLTWLNLSGGDFVERQDAPQILDHVARLLPDLCLLDFPTAGQNPEATLAAIEPLLDSPIPHIYVSVSLDGDDETHDNIRRQQGAAARARETLRRLTAIQRTGFHAVAGFTLSSHSSSVTKGEPPAAILPPGVDPREIHLNLGHQSDHYYRNQQDSLPEKETALALIDHLAGFSHPTLLGWIERKYWKIARQYLRTGDVGGPCAAMKASVFLAADLTVYPCSIFDAPIGDLSKVGYALRRISEFKSTPQTLESVENRQCPNCWSPCEAFPTLLYNYGRFP